MDEHTDPERERWRAAVSKTIAELDEAATKATDPRRRKDFMKRVGMLRSVLAEDEAGRATVGAQG